MKAIVFDFEGVLIEKGKINKQLFFWIKKNRENFFFGIFTNSPEQEILKKLNSNINLFSIIITPEKTGFFKPEKESFLHLNNELGFLSELEAVLFIDDRLENVLAAEANNINSFLYIDEKSFLEKIKNFDK